MSVTASFVQGLAVVIMSFGTSASLRAAASVNENILRPIEIRPSEQTREFLRSLFSRATEVEFRFTPFKDVELRGYVPNVSAMKYSYVEHCGHSCIATSGELLDRLANARLAEGACPWIIGAIIFRKNNKTVGDKIMVGAEGNCIVIGGSAYVLDRERSLKHLFESADSLFW